jgi:hypothetical protein
LVWQAKGLLGTERGTASAFLKLTSRDHGPWVRKQSA